jgi:hypothetical protein
MNGGMKMFITVQNVANKDLEAVPVAENTTLELEKIMTVKYSVQKTVLINITQKNMRKEK